MKNLLNEKGLPKYMAYKLETLIESDSNEGKLAILLFAKPKDLLIYCFNL